MYLFVPCDKKSHGTEISFPIRSNRLSHPHPLTRNHDMTTLTLCKLAIKSFGKMCMLTLLCLCLRVFTFLF